MRLSALALAAAMAVAGCGGDEPDAAQEGFTPRPTPQRPATDTTVGDTSDPVARADSPTRADDPGGQPGQPTDQAAPVPGRAGGTATPPDAPPAANRQRLYTVQVAAFTESASAVEWARRLQSQDLPVWTSMAELGGRTFYRVRVGAVPTVGEARRLGSLISRRYEWPIWVAPISPAEQVPENAVGDTRRILGGG